MLKVSPVRNGCCCRVRVMQVKRLPSVCTVRSRTSGGVAGFHSGPKPLCTSVEM
jgi:hypothetical protein